jgi:hypothetical protein
VGTDEREKERRQVEIKTEMGLTASFLLRYILKQFSFFLYFYMKIIIKYYKKY